MEGLRTSSGDLYWLGTDSSISGFTLSNSSVRSANICSNLHLEKIYGWHT